MKYKRINKCTICNKKINHKNKIVFNKFPITEIFVNKPSQKKINYKQQINFCNNCNHISLGYQYDPSNFYNENYLNSSQSYSNQFSNNFFLDFIKKNLKKNKNNVIEIGANDLFLLEKFKKYSSKAIAIDPCITPNKKFKFIKCIKKFAENVDLSEINFKPDIILCSQTLEHIENPVKFLADTIKFGDANTKYFFQFPSCESLIDRYAFDQLHHQHFNLFSLNSIQKILSKNNLTLIDYDFNEHHYGSLMIYFKSNKKNKIIKTYKNEISLKERYNIYKKFIDNIISIIKKYKSRKFKVYAVGAGLMTPVLNYQLNGLLNLVDNILDDDKNKINKYFPNINSKIKSLKKTNLNNSVAIISSTASSITTRKLISIVEKKNAKIIIVPTLSY